MADQKPHSTVWNYRSKGELNTHNSGLSMCELHMGLSDILGSVKEEA